MVNTSGGQAAGREVAEGTADQCDVDLAHGFSGFSKAISGSGALPLALDSRSRSDDTALMRIVDVLDDMPGPVRAAGLAVIAAAFALTAAATQWEGRWTGGALVAWGVLFAGTGGASIGRRQFRTGERSQLTAGISARAHSGAPAVLLGTSLLALGLVLLVGGMAALFGVGESVAVTTLRRPGPVLIVLGAWGLMVGVALVLSRWRYMDASTTWWQRVPSQMAGVLLSVIGVALVALGLQALGTEASWRDVFTQVFNLTARVLAG